VKYGEILFLKKRIYCQRLSIGQAAFHAELQFAAFH